MFEIGNSLREARTRRQVDLVDVEDATKIRSKYLSALETEDFDVLPGAVYARGFLRTYSHYLGLDSQLYIDEYNARFGQFVEEEPAPTTVLSRPRRRVFNLRNLTILSLAAIALISWLGLRAEPQKSAKHDRAIDSMNQQSKIDEPLVEQPRRAVVATVPTQTSVRLVIAATRGDSWVEIRRGGANGPVLFAGTLTQGTKRGFKARKLFVNVGYPSAVELSAAGKKVAPETSEALRFVVTAGGIKQLG